MSVVSDDIEPLVFVFEDDGIVPNNPLPFLLYRQAISIDNGHPEQTIEGLFGVNGWGHQIWRDGVYDYLHYHATVHEALGIARGHARVKFGGIPARKSRSRLVTSRSCRPAPGTNACLRARISA
jgi:uncharacterized protein YjlB